MAASIDFVSLGLVVLDEIHVPSSGALQSAVGGSGTYCMLGTRLFSSVHQSRSLGWLIRTGNDFPKDIENELSTWNTTLIFLRNDESSSTRGLLKYKDSAWGPKDFSYTTPVLSVSPWDLMGTPLLRSESFHFLAKPDILRDSVTQLMSLREQNGHYPRPFIVWEPAPPFCSPEELEECVKASQLVHVFSPNHIEIAKFFGVADNEILSESYLEHLARLFLEKAAENGGDDLPLLVRVAERGAFIISRSQSLIARWYPAFYGQEPTISQSPYSAKKLVDPTGAGNAFLGAFTHGYQKTKSMHEAACRGAVASSFALEQLWLPGMTFARDGIELWNGEASRARLDQYKAKHLLGCAATS